MGEVGEVGDVGEVGEVDEVFIYSIREESTEATFFGASEHDLTGSVSDPYLSNSEPDPDPANNLNPDP